MTCQHCRRVIGSDEGSQRLEPFSQSGPETGHTLYVHRACILPALAAAASDPRAPRRH